MYIVLPNMFSLIILTIMTGISAYFDIKTRQLNLIILAAGAVLSTACIIFTHEFDLIQSLIGLAIGGIPLLMLALVKKGGGGDAILCGILGWCSGAQGILYILIFTTVIYITGGIIYGLKTRNADEKMSDILKKQYPFAPAVLAGWATYIVLGFVF